MSPLLTALVAGVSIPIGILLYLVLGEALLKRAGTVVGRRVRVGLWLAPALVLMVLTLVYPMISTIVLSLKDARGERFVGLKNYIDVLTRPETLIAVRNNILWILVYTVFVTAIGLAVATLADRVGYEKLVRTIVVLPTAISFVGAGVIWSFMYAYDPPGLPQTGTINALLTAVFPKVDPVAWLADKTTVNGALVFIGVWMSVGLASVILSAAVKAVPVDTIEAARIDGASESRIFRSVILPQIAPSVVVVMTMMAVNALKIFDIIYVLTNGNYDSEVLATMMYIRDVLLSELRLRERDRGRPPPHARPRPHHERQVLPGAVRMGSLAAPPRTHHRLSASGLAGLFFKHAALIVIMVIWIVPILALLVSSFRSYLDISSSGWWTAILPPYRFTLENYSTVLERSNMAQAFINSILITVPITLIVLVIASLAGFVFARWRFKGRQIVFVVILALLSIPLQMTLVPVLKLFSAWGIVGTFPAVWIAHSGYGLPFAIYLMRNFFAGIPEEIFESASIDGASDLQSFWRIGVPLATPALAAVGVFQFMWVWNDLLISLIFLGGAPKVAPLTVAVSSLLNSRGEGWEVLTAAAFILMAVPIVVFFALQRYFVRGLTAGAVKS
ncbi:ABC transporter permease [Actinomyces culturomici]|uniref:ABC transporter permease n=1 Tax=Actinomyces culturomici TaxID=1926276 RepID=UPI000E1FF4F8|nr:ABC transporter permease subunit [Actinomyces culturomici]